MEIGEILIEVLRHRPGKMVTMISSSVGLKFVKKGIKNEKSFSRAERGGEGGRRKDAQNWRPYRHTENACRHK